MTSSAISAESAEICRVVEPRGGHVLRLQADGDVIVARIECHEVEGAACRMGCARPDCDRESPLPHADDEGGGVHGETDCGCCVITADWLNGCVAEFHDGSVIETISDGMPVILVWDAEVYVWRGAEPAATASSDGRH